MTTSSRSTAGLVSSGLVVTGVGAVANAAFLLTLVRTSGTSSAGVVVLSVAIQVLMFRVGDLGATGSVVRFLSADGDEQRSGVLNPLVVAVPAVLLATVAGGTALFLAADVIGQTLASDSAATMAQSLRYVAIGAPVYALYMFFVHGLKGFERFAAFRIIERLGRPLLYLAIAAFASDDPAHVVAAMQLVHAGLLLVALVVFARAAAAAGFRRARTFRGSAEFWRFSLPLGASRLVDGALTWADTLVIAALLSPAAAATYTVVSRVLLLHSFSVDSSAEVGGPRFSRAAARDDRPQLRRDYLALTSFQVGVVWPSSVVLLVFMPELLHVADSSLTDGATAARWICLGAMVGALAGPAVTLRAMMGRSGQLLVVSALALAVDLALNASLLRSFGVSVAGFAWAAALLVSVGVPWWLSHQVHKVGAGELVGIAVRAARVPTAVALVAWLVTAGGHRPAGALIAVVVGVAFTARTLLGARSAVSTATPVNA